MCTYAANMLGKDLDKFTTGSISVNDIYTKKLVIKSNYYYYIMIISHLVIDCIILYLWAFTYFYTTVNYIISF
jgi:hypothetical protein